MPDNNKDRANLGEQGGRRSSSDDVLSKPGIDRTHEDLKKLEKDVDDLTIRRGTERDRDVRERSQVEREGGKFERGRSETREGSTRDTGSIRRASESTPKGGESDSTGTGSESGSTGGAKGGKVAGSGFTMEESENSKKGYSSSPGSLERTKESRKVKSVERSGSLSEPERKEDRSIDRNRDIDRSKM